MMTDPPPPVIGDMAPLSERPVCVARVYAAEPLETEGELFALGFGADGTLWSVEGRGLLRHWDLGTSRLIDNHPLDDIGSLWCFGPGCRIVASGCDEVTLWDVVTGHEIVTLSELPWVTALAFSTDGKRLAMGHDDGSVRLWDIDRCRE